MFADVDKKNWGNTSGSSKQLFRKYSLKSIEEPPLSRFLGLKRPGVAKHVDRFDTRPDKEDEMLEIRGSIRPGLEAQRTISFQVFTPANAWTVPPRPP